MQIEMRDISKAFGQNRVLLGVNLTVRPGEIHALMGENGAGKSTLMNILTGLHKADNGTIRVDGEERVFTSPREAEDFGIAFVHQELNIWPNLTILENLFLMRPLKNSWGMLDWDRMRELAAAKCDELNISLPLEKEAQECSVGQQQLTEIVRMLMLDAQIVIMDEPTAALSERETEVLFRVLGQMRTKGVGIIYISHRMEEVFELCDAVTVMRDGMAISTQPVAKTTMDRVVSDMVGRSLTEYYPERTVTPGKVVFEINNLNSAGVFYDVSFTIREGEILGIAGLMGAGRTEIMRALFGVDKKDSCEIKIHGQAMKIDNPSDAIKAGIGFITENRKTEGLILDFSIGDNISLPSIEKFASHKYVRRGAENEFTEMLAKRLGVKAQSLTEPVGTLSGGNQQKVVIAKWIGMKPAILIMDEPTRGIDVGAKRDIYDLMNELTAAGVAIIMVSSELPEVIGMSDRIMVIREGSIAGVLDRSEATQEKIITLATGGQ